jgi:hypothetical protein
VLTTVTGFVVADGAVCDGSPLGVTPSIGVGGASSVVSCCAGLLVVTGNLRQADLKPVIT